MLGLSSLLLNKGEDDGDKLGRCCAGGDDARPNARGRVRTGGIVSSENSRLYSGCPGECSRSMNEVFFDDRKEDDGKNWERPRERPRKEVNEDGECDGAASLRDDTSFI
jgi:hypothetical protein